LFTLSEIVFNKKHNRGIVTYSSVSGSLCGNGNTLVLKRTGRAWRVTKGVGDGFREQDNNRFEYRISLLMLARPAE